MSSKRALWAVKFMKTLNLRLAMLRQRVLARVFSHLYGQPMQVAPASYVGLGGAVVIWCVRDGGRQLVMVRNPNSPDGRARFVSLLGLGRSTDMAMAMRSAVRDQLGEKFTNTLKLDKMLTPDRVAAAPMFTYTDEDHGIVSPVQMLVWVVPIDPVQLELVQVGTGCELVLVAESQLQNGKVAGVIPTHVAVWRSVKRHLPIRALPREEDLLAREERVAEEKVRATKVLH